MELQVCHCCGWSKVTTYQGLRIHQGKMGCTPKGVRVAEPQQKYSWGYVGHANTQIDLKLDVRTSFKIETTEHSNLSLQVCHCGWSKLTTYQGLRIHQGKMGCTTKGARIPKKEQYDWKNQREEMDHRKHLPAKKEIVKKELSPESPSTYSCARAGATAIFKEEYKLTAHAQWSSQRASNHQLQELPTLPQVSRPAREPSAPPYPGNVVRPKKKKNKQQTLSQMEGSSAMAGYWSADCYADYATPAIKVKEEPKSPLATPQSSFQRAASRRPQEFSTAVAVQQSVREPPSPRPLEAAAVLPVRKKRKEHRQNSAQPAKISSCVNSTASDRIEEEYKSATSAFAQRSSQRANNSKSDHQLQEFFTFPQLTGHAREPSAPPYPGNMHTHKEKKMNQQILSQTEDSSAVAGYLSIDRSADCATTATKVNEKPESPLTTPQPSFQRATSSQQRRENPTCPQGNKSAQDHPPSPPPVPPKKNSALLKKMLERFEEKSQPKIQMTEGKTCEIRPAETACRPESVPNLTSTNSQTGSAAADVSAKENPALLNEATEAEVSTGMKVKELAHRFSATTASKRVVPPKEKHGAPQKLSQVKLLTQRFSAISAQETAAKAKQKHREEEKRSQMLTDSTRDATQINSAAAKATVEKEPELSCENAPFSDFSSGLKVKDLARMFSASATQENAIGPKEKQRGEQKPAQRVKLLVQKLSARESKDHHKEKDEEDQKPSKRM